MTLGRPASISTTTRLPRRRGLRRASRVGLLGPSRCRPLLLNNQEPFICINHMLDRPIHVAWEDEEVSRIAAHRLILSPRRFERLMAAELVALTEELQRPLSSRGRLTELLDPLIDLTEQILVLVFRVTHFTDAPGSLVATIVRRGKFGDQQRRYGTLMQNLESFQALQGALVRDGFDSTLRAWREGDEAVMTLTVALHEAQTPERMAKLADVVGAKGF